jgi:hypothetical protein
MLWLPQIGIHRKVSRASLFRSTSNLNGADPGLFQGFVNLLFLIKTNV